MPNPLRALARSILRQTPPPVRRLLSQWRQIPYHACFPVRRATAAWRPLPSVLLIGAQKCGTTSLHHILGQHPGVAISLLKEVYFFNQHFQRGEGWYRSALPMERGGGRLVMESTPGYMLHPHVPGRVRATLPGVKIIAMLRDPAARAHSGWRHMLRAGFETLPFEEAIAQEPERTDAAWAALLADPRAGVPPFFYHTYLRRGRYAEQLQRWYSIFPASDILLVRSEDFFRDPGAVVAQVVEWLGLPPWSGFDYAGKNIHDARGASGASPMRDGFDDGMRSRLRRYFEPFNQDLLKLTGRDFGW